jgi:4-hydroxy-3-polyprenylbenzoate decarboxylase
MATGGMEGEFVGVSGGEVVAGLGRLMNGHGSFAARSVDNFGVEQPQSARVKVANRLIDFQFFNTPAFCASAALTQAGSEPNGLAPGPGSGHIPADDTALLSARGVRGLRILVAITGASGTIYAQRLLDSLDSSEHEVHLVLSGYAQAVIAEELPGGLRLSKQVTTHGLRSMNAPFASGSNPFDAMVVIPCTMGTVGRIAHGVSDDVLLRAADVMLKERRKLILVPRETPLNLIHIKNFELLLLAGAMILPANPSFYTRPTTLQEAADTVVARVLDHLGVAHTLMPRWQEEKE